MLPTKIYSLTLSANQTVRLLNQGQLFKIIKSTGPVTVESNFGRLDDLMTGQGLENTPFDFLVLTEKSGAVNTIKLLIGDENFIDAAAGNMVVTQTVQPISGSFVNAQKTVTTASAVLIAANPSRMYLMIQNKDILGNMYIAFGTAATVANGIKILPGGSYEMSNAQTNQDIYAIGDIASNTNIVVVQG